MGTVPNPSYGAHASNSQSHPRPTWPVFDPDAGVPDYLYMKLADYLADRIADGLLPPGAMLPRERGLAEEFGVSVGTTRRAVGVLRERDLVITLRGRGTFVQRQT